MQAPTQTPAPARSHRWLTPKEIAINLVAAVALTVVVYLFAGQPFIFWGLETSAYYFGHTTTATVIATGVSDYYGVPGDDATPQVGATGRYVAADGHSYTIFLQHANQLHEQVPVSYLPFLLGIAVERADYEARPALYLVLFSVSAIIVYLYCRYVLKRLLTWRIKLDWRIKTISRRTNGLLPKSANYRI